MRDASLAQVEVIDLRDTAPSMDYQIRFEALTDIVNRSTYQQVTAAFFNACDGSIQEDFYAEIARCAQQVTHQIRIES
jgi:hypothetical protein